MKMTTGKVYRVLISVGTLILAAALLCACGSSPEQQQEGVPLSRAIGEAAARVEKNLPAGTKLALLNFNAPSETFSRYVLDELTAIFVTNGNLVIVDRKDIDLLRGETQFQLSGEVSDESAQSIGQMLGAQSILSGSLMELGGVYRFIVKVLNVETARVEVLFPQDLRPDDRVAALLGIVLVKTQTRAGSARQTSAASRTSGALQLENYPPELDRRLAELSALPAVTDAIELIAQHDAWEAMLQYVETWYKERPEFAIVYDPAPVQENIDYNRGTVTVKTVVSLTPLSGYEKAITDVRKALEKTGRSEEWNWENWPGDMSFYGGGGMRLPTYFINYEGIFNPQMIGPTTGGTRAGFLDANIGRRYRQSNFIIDSHDLQTFGKIVVVRAALLNANNEVIGRGEQRLRFAVAYRETWATGLGSSSPRPKNSITFSPIAISEWFVFSGVEASDLSGKVTLKIISIDGVALDSKDSDYIRISEESINKK
jgi:hypothetical protein